MTELRRPPDEYQARLGPFIVTHEWVDRGYSVWPVGNIYFAISRMWHGPSILDPNGPDRRFIIDSTGMMIFGFDRTAGDRHECLVATQEIWNLLGRHCPEEADFLLGIEAKVIEQRVLLEESGAMRWPSD